jgi:hypothetical protein
VVVVDEVVDVDVEVEVEVEVEASVLVVVGASSAWLSGALWARTMEVTMTTAMAVSSNNESLFPFGRARL